MKTRRSDDQVGDEITPQRKKSKLNSTPIVRLERISGTDKNTAVASTSSKNVKSSSVGLASTCFLCGKNIQLPCPTQGRRHYVKQVELFKDYLMAMTTNSMSTPLSMNKNNVKTCDKCVEEIKEVWDLNQEIEAIRQDIQKIVERVAATLTITGSGSRDLEQSTRSKIGSGGKSNSKGMLHSKPKNTISKTTYRDKSDDDGNVDSGQDSRPDPNSMLRIEFKQDFSWSENEDNNVSPDDEVSFEMMPVYPKQDTENFVESGSEQDIPGQLNPESVPSSPSKSLRPKRKSRLRAEELLRGVISDNGTKQENSDSEGDNGMIEPGEDSSGEDEYDSDEFQEDMDNSHSPTKRRRKTDSTTNCEQCGKSFACRRYLRAHIRYTHLNRLNRKCEYCEKAFSSITHLTQHIKWNHTGEVFTCSSCHKKLASRRRWAIHEANVCKVKDKGWSAERLKNEFNIILLPCPVPGCEKQFDRPSEVEKHVVTHTKARPFACPTCDKTFTQKCSLLQHTASICGPDADPDLLLKLNLRSRVNKKKPKTFSCHVCRPRRRFIKEATLAAHNLQFHSNTETSGQQQADRNVGTNILCDLCGVSMRPNQLSIHKRRVHEGQRTVPCPQCGKCFFGTTDRNRHVANVHEKVPKPFGETENEPKHICGDCGQQFRHRNSLKDHQDRVHRGEAKRKHVCSKCPRAFYKPSDLLKHLNTHSMHGWWCVDCGRNFDSQRKLEEHQENLDGKICEPIKRAKKPKRPRGIKDGEMYFAEVIVDQDLQQVPNTGEEVPT